MISRGTTELLTRLQQHRVELWLEGDRVRFAAAEIPTELVAAIARREREIAGFLRAVPESPGPREATPIRRVERRGPLGCSFVQRRLWALHRTRARTAAGNMQVCVTLRGRLDPVALEGSLRDVIGRHEMLRTAFHPSGDDVVQSVAEAVEFELRIVDFSSDASPVVEAISWAEGRADVEFDLERAPLLEATLAVVAPQEHLLSITLSHLVADGWSAWILWRDLAEFYRARVRGVGAELPALDVQYADYAAWQGEHHPEVEAGLLQYWLPRLQDLPTLTLPTDRPRPSRQCSAGALWSRLVDRDTVNRVAALGSEEGSTTFITVLAAFKILLGHYCEQDDVVVGTPVANRERVEFEFVVGAFVNSLVLRTDLSGSSTFRECLRRVRETAVGGFEHQAMPFEKLVDELRPKRAVEMTPLFQVMFKTDGAFVDWADLDGVEALDAELGTATAKYDLTLGIAEAAGGLRLDFEYRTSLFDEKTIARMSDHLAALLGAAVDHPDRSPSWLLERAIGRSPLVRKEVSSPEPTSSSSEPFVAPRTEAEIAVARIWQRVLEVDRVSVHDNFYELGGHSMLSMRVAYLIQKEVGIEVEPTDLLLETLRTVASGGASVTCEDPRESAPEPPSGVRPMFFGRECDDLFGVYHPPEAGSARSWGVVLCPGFGPELIAAHRSLVRLARRCAELGFPSLRFDYLGTGDSAGSIHDASLERWLDDVVTAGRTLRELGGVRHVCVVGLRLGASLAAMAREREGGDPWDATVLWEPVIDGDRHVDRMLSDHEAWRRSTFVRRRSMRREEPPQVLGFELPDRLRDSMRAIDLTSLPRRAGRTLVVWNAPVDEGPATADRVRDGLPDHEHRVIEEAAPWSGRHGATLGHGGTATQGEIVRWIVDDPLAGGTGR